MIPYLVTVLDGVNDEVLKQANDDIENKIDELVKGGLARDIAVPTTVSIGSSCAPTVYTNFLYGKQGKDISNASECSIYRGALENGGQLVEANRGYAIGNVQSDLNACQKAETYGYWGGNSPVNLDANKSSKGVMTLKGRDNSLAITPLFDIA